MQMDLTMNFMLQHSKKKGLTFAPQINVNHQLFLHQMFIYERVVALILLHCLPTFKLGKLVCSC